MTVKECAARLLESDDILVFTHRRPDGDTLGSASALCLALRKMGKRAYLFHNPQITENYLYFTDPLAAPEGFSPSLNVAVDVADRDMIPGGFTGTIDLCIDHHPTGRAYAAESLIDPGKASCGEIVMQVIETMDCAIDEHMAELLYIAVSTDTGCFRYANTNADTLRAAARLIELGAPNAKVNRNFFRTATLPRLMLEGEIYTHMNVYFGGALTTVVVTLDMMAKTGADESDCEDIANLVGRAQGNKVGVTVRELSCGKCKASLRTDGSVDAGAFCERFGGGGHKMAAGCDFDCSGAEAERLIVEAVKEIWR